MPIPNDNLENTKNRWPTSFSPGQIFGERYQITQEMNSLGQWEVYLAQEVSTEKKVVIKFWRLSPETLIQYQPKLELRLYQLRNIQHPNILEILDYRFQYNRFYVVQEFSTGIHYKKYLLPKFFYQYLK